VVKCPKDGVEYREAETSFEYHGVVVPSVPCLKCPKCGEMLFSPEQVRYIRERVALLAPEIKFIRKVSKAGNRPALYLPDMVVEALKLHPGDEVSIYIEGRKRMVVEPVETS